jgi:AcrR family transcriptional regulator
MNAQTRLSAAERREVVIAAVTQELAAGGYAGTSTQSIAKRVGVCQP